MIPPLEERRCRSIAAGLGVGATGAEEEEEHHPRAVSLAVAPSRWRAHWSGVHGRSFWEGVNLHFHDALLRRLDGRGTEYVSRCRVVRSEKRSLSGGVEGASTLSVVGNGCPCTERGSAARLQASSLAPPGLASSQI